MSAPRLLPAAALVLAACSADPVAPPAATHGVIAPEAATAPVVACTVEPFLSGYAAVVVWQRTPATTVSLRATGAALDEPLAKRTRNGSVRVQLTFIPTNVVLLARTKVSGGSTCTFISS